MPPAFPPEPKPEGVTLRELALRAAREDRKAYYVVTVPKTNYEYTPTIPYYVAADQADEYERANGERIEP